MDRLKRFFGFLKFGYERQTGTVVVTLRLNFQFILGAVAAAFLMTLLFRYRDISLGSAWQLLMDVIGPWPLFILVTVAVILLTSIRVRHGTSEEVRSRLSVLLVPNDVRGVAVQCLLLLAFLVFLMWGSSGESPEPTEARQLERPARSSERYAEPPPDSRRLTGEETPRLLKELGRSQ